MMKDAKYFFAYIAPLTAFLGLYFGGFWSFGAAYLAFLVIPLLEFFTPGTTQNLSPEEEKEKVDSSFFDWLIYINLPILYVIVFYYLLKISGGDLTAFEMVGMTFNVSVIIAILGINVAHELGHRSKKYEQTMSKMMLLTALYMHFFIEHNRGHHKNVATPEDPASSRLGENLYTFWFRSVTGSYRNAWRLENNRLRKVGNPIFSMHNEMVGYTIIQLLYLSAIGLYFGGMAIFFAIAIAIGGFLMLETVNYIEHYGLSRKKLPNGRYETVQPHHSWNSNHEMGRLFLYELTRHSDHHYKANRKYQVLRHFDHSPQMPYGYPAAMILSFFPPIWFRMMDKRALEWRQ